jgi:hypothetical protein
MDLTGVLHVLDRNACRSCRRPIELIKNVGWLHGELPQYAAEELTCDTAAPVDPRCPVCDDLISAAQIGKGRKLSYHRVKGVVCEGSGAIVAEPT